jgi:ubiquinone/menaquinone biosynthesis C-methylase UbiE
LDEERIRKLENPERVSALDPENTLIRAGFENGMTLCDVGAGTGLFSFAAAGISSGNIYALEISDVMIGFLSEVKARRSVSNLTILKVVSDILPLEDKSCDMAVMCAVLHELEGKEAMLGEIGRILRESGILLVIDWQKRERP